jgi:magnesium-transporting ATPase (P-type)
VVADGVVFEAHGLVLDEASLTGEADGIKKSPEEDCWVRSGTQVRAALGRGLAGLQGGLGAPATWWLRCRRVRRVAGPQLLRCSCSCR